MLRYNDKFESATAGGRRPRPQAEDSEAALSEQTSNGMMLHIQLDEEAADLIRFQQAYQASAQVIQMSQRLFDTLIQAS